MRVRTRRTHRVADGLAHAPHLAVAALVDREPQQRRGGTSATCAGAVIPSSSSTPSRSRRSAPGDGRALDLGEVLLLDAERRVGEAVGEVAVVGEQQQALGVGVEAADREHPRLVAAPARPRWAGPAGRARW